MPIRLFISHASEDKAEVARPLAIQLKQLGFDVWFDEYSLEVGDSLRRSIDAGVAEADFGAVILSKAFFAKEWPQRELDALLGKEDTDGKVILPIWHGVNRVEVAARSPLLSERLAVSTSVGLEQVARRLQTAILRDTRRKKLKRSIAAERFVLVVPIEGRRLADAVTSSVPIATGLHSIAQKHVASVSLTLYEDLSGIDPDESFVAFSDGTRISLDSGTLLRVGPLACPVIAEKYTALTWEIRGSGCESRDLSEQQVAMVFGRPISTLGEGSEREEYLRQVVNFYENLWQVTEEFWDEHCSVGRQLIREIAKSGDGSIFSELLTRPRSERDRNPFLYAQALVEELSRTNITVLYPAVSVLLDRDSVLNDYWRTQLRAKLNAFAASA